MELCNKKAVDLEHVHSLFTDSVTLVQKPGFLMSQFLHLQNEEKILLSEFL